MRAWTNGEGVPVTKHIVFGDEETERWRLPADSDVEALRDSIEEAVRLGCAVRVQVEDGHGHAHGELLLNGRTLRYAVILRD
jgi:hypothetical protein